MPLRSAHWLKAALWLTIMAAVVSGRCNDQYTTCSLCSADTGCKWCDDNECHFSWSLMCTRVDQCPAPPPPQPPTYPPCTSAAACSNARGVVIKGQYACCPMGNGVEPVTVHCTNWMDPSTCTCPSAPDCTPPPPPATYSWVQQPCPVCPFACGVIDWTQDTRCPVICHKSTDPPGAASLDLLCDAATKPLKYACDSILPCPPSSSTGAAAAGADGGSNGHGSSSSASSSNNLPLPVIMGIAAGIIFVLLLLTFGGVWWYRRHQQSKQVLQSMFTKEAMGSCSVALLEVTAASSQA